VQGLSQRQIADLLDVPETTVETRLARARRMLRQLASTTEGQ
jgi:DNA-directed RNA polymerase specialized sigma24 family protein